MKRLFLALLTAGLTMVASHQASAIVYSISDTASNPPYTLSVSGTITTNGDLGVLDASDITGWSLNLSGFGTFALDSSNSHVIVGAGLTATPTALVFDYGSPGASFLGFYFNGPPADNPAVFWGGKDICGNEPLGGCFQLLLGDASALVFRTGAPTLADVSVSGVPLPPALILFGSGIAVLALFGARRKRRAHEVA